MEDADTLQPFIFENSNVRGKIIHLNQSFITIMEQHHYPSPIRKLLGETITAAVLLSATIKFKGNLTIQFQSTGILKLLVAKCDNEFHIRGLAQYDVEALPRVDAQSPLLEKGQLVVTIQPDDIKAKAYQSIIDIENHSIVETLEKYFAQSEQIPTKLWLEVGEDNTAGILLQLLPEQASKHREDFWRDAVLLGETIGNNQFLKLNNATTIQTLFPGKDIRLFDAQPVSFRCTCNPVRMENAVYLLGKEDAFELLADKQEIVVTCEFCNRNFGFDKIDVTAIFRKHKKTSEE